MTIIGITGTIGAGKGTLVEYFVKEKNFVHYSVRGYLIEELNRRNIPLNRDTMTSLANELRRENSSSYIIDCLFEQAKQSKRNAIIESIRTVGEVESLRKKGDFCLLAVDAHPEIRYKRVIQRNSDTDHITFEEFLSDEQREMASTDPNKQNINQCIVLADHVLSNNGTLDELYAQLTIILTKMSY